MEYKSDIQIAQECEMLHIDEIARRAHVDDKYIEHYGRYKAKVDLSLLSETDRPDGKLILVTAITPTPAGEGKTTTTIGLADGLRRIGKDVVVALREPSLGPVFGIKGGAAGGGYAQVVPMEDINLHFTGDFHAIGAANNLLAAMLDNHIQQGNALGIDVRKITWKRCVDMNDRQLRNVIDGLGGRMQGVPREDGFDITVASEIMAVLCLASDIPDLKARLARIVVAYTYDGKGNLIKEIQSYYDGDKSIYDYTYNKKGNKIGYVYTDTDGEKYTAEYTYDNKGNVTHEVHADSDGYETKYDFIYDDKDNLIKKIYTL